MMRKLDSREYKLLVQHEPFAEPPEAVKAVWNEIEEAVESLSRVRTKDKFDKTEIRTINFLDTPDHTLRRRGLVLRRRVEEDTVEYTLKCRSEDRFFAAGTDVSSGPGWEDKQKLEEDIAPPFRCRFSHSAKIKMSEDEHEEFGKMPSTLRDAADLFPLLGTLRLDGRPCAPETPLDVVNDITVRETVWKGGKFVFEDRDGNELDKASVALILWTRGKQTRPAVAELSFRIKENEEDFTRELAEPTGRLTSCCNVWTAPGRAGRRRRSTSIVTARATEIAKTWLVFS